MPENIREEVFNTLLAEQLMKRGQTARAESRSRRGTPDIRIDLHGADHVIL